MSNNLTSLCAVKAWANVTTSGDDPVLTRLIASCSRFILSYIERPSLFQKQYTDLVDGVGQRSQLLRNWPVISVQSLLIGTRLIPASPAYPQPGYVLDSWDGVPPGSQQRINLLGHHFPRDAIASISITYTAGFVVQNEAWTVPSAPYQVAVNAPHGNWGADQGVTYANGTPLTPITSGNPATGQYLPPADSSGSYQFAAGDIGAAVLISYSYIPADIEDACINMVAERYSYRGRVGMVSKSLSGQETVSFSQKDMPDYIQTMLQPYKSMVPV